MALELPLADGAVQLLAKVLYTNVTGNLHRDSLPNGMGVHFLRTPDPDQLAICRCVESAASHYFV